MYAKFFGLKQEPFSIAPDPRYLFMSKRHRDALAHLLYGVKSGGGFVLLSGEIGAGKTTVCRCFLEQIPKRCNVAYIFNPKLTVTELLSSVCDEFGIPYTPPPSGTATVKDYLDPLNDFLLRTHAVGQKNVLIIDEAQLLSADVLEQLRLLTNLETNERKLLQIVLIGQPELRTMIARPELEQLAQRVIARFHLKALGANDTQRYIAHRLAVGGMDRGTLFDRQALERIHAISRGIPRRINLLCDRALLGAYAKGTAHIGKDIIDKAALEVFGQSEPLPRGPSRWQRLASLWLGLVAVVSGAAYTATALTAEHTAQANTLAVATPAPAAAPMPPGRTTATALAMADLPAIGAGVRSDLNESATGPFSAAHAASSAWSVAQATPAEARTQDTSDLAAMEAINAAPRPEPTAAIAVLEDEAIGVVANSAAAPPRTYQTDAAAKSEVLRARPTTPTAAIASSTQTTREEAERAPAATTMHTPLATPGPAVTFSTHGDQGAAGSSWSTAQSALIRVGATAAGSPTPRLRGTVASTVRAEAAP